MLDITIDSLFAGKLRVMFYYTDGMDTRSEKAICLDRDASGILLQLGDVVAYYPWHRIERVTVDTGEPPERFIDIAIDDLEQGVADR